MFFESQDAAPPKRFTLFCGCLLLAVLGAAYATFNVVAPVVAQQLNYSAAEVTMVANAGIFGSWLHITNGWYLSVFGPRATIRIGLVLWLAGFLGIAASLHGWLDLRAPWQLALLNFTGMHGASFGTMAALASVPQLYNSVDRPAMMAALGGTFALGQAFISTLYAVALRNLSLEAHFVAIALLGAALLLKARSIFPLHGPIPHAVTHQPPPPQQPVSAFTIGAGGGDDATGVAPIAASPTTGAFSAMAASAAAPLPLDGGLTPMEHQQRDVVYGVILAVSGLFFAVHMLQLYADTNPDATPNQQATVFLFALIVLAVASWLFVAMPAVTRCVLPVATRVRATPGGVPASNGGVFPAHTPTTSLAAAVASVQGPSAVASSSPPTSSLSLRNITQHHHHHAAPTGLSQRLARATGSRAGNMDDDGAFLLAGGGGDDSTTTGTPPAPSPAVSSAAPVPAGAGGVEPGTPTATPPDSHHPNDNSLSEKIVDAASIGFPGLLRHPDFWLLLVSYLCCGGLASSVNSIVALIVAAVYPLDTSRPLKATPPDVLLTAGQLFALGAMGRCWGGLCIGRATELARHRFGLSRVAVCLVCHTLSVTAYTLLYATLSVPWMYFTVPLVNFAWGMLYSSSQVVAVETFGARNFSALWGALSSSPCVSTFVFAVGIAGRMADQEKARGSVVMIAGHLSCHGTECYRGALGWFAVIAFIGMGSMLLLAWRRGAPVKVAVRKA